MTQVERRSSERLLLTIPIRVMGYDAAGERFSEDTQTIVVTRAGARIALRRRVVANETLRIVNLGNYSEADFRVVGPTRLSGGEVTEWGVECTEPGRNLWGIELPPPMSAEGSEAAGLLECKACHTQGLWALTLMDAEVLDSTGLLQRACTKCGKPTAWMHADASRHPREFAPLDTVVPAPRQPQGEKRREKRVGMKLPILVESTGGEKEVAKTENMSKKGFAVTLAMNLAVGDVVSIVCPYSPGGQDIPQKAEVRRCAPFFFGGRRLYGFRYVR